MEYCAATGHGLQGREGCYASATPINQGPRRDPRPPLPYSSREDLRPLDPALHPTSRPAPPRELGATEVSAFLTHLAVRGRVAAATQNQALCAIQFLYRHVFEIDIGWIDGVVRDRERVRVRVVLSPGEVSAVFAQMTERHALISLLLYGTGLRLSEALALRYKDVDFHYRQLCVRDGKGRRDRVTVLPDSVIDALRAQLERVRLLHLRDVERGFAGCSLPHAPARKYPDAPHAPSVFG